MFFLNFIRSLRASWTNFSLNCSPRCYFCTSPVLGCLLACPLQTAMSAKMPSESAALQTNNATACRKITAQSPLSLLMSSSKLVLLGLCSTFSHAIIVKMTCCSSSSTYYGRSKVLLELWQRLPLLLREMRTLQIL